MSKVVHLKRKIVEASTAYYLGNPIMSDEEFDNLVFEFSKLCPNDSLLYEIGWGSKFESEDLKKVSHDIKIVRGFDKIKVSGNSKIFPLGKGHYDTLKYDGASVTLYYDYNGNLEKAVTRNDGRSGFDVTDKLKYVVPTHIDLPIHAITGEWILSKEENENYFHSNSPRNVAVGALMKKSINPKEIVRFDFVAYRIISFHSNTRDSRYLAESLVTQRSKINEILRDLHFNYAPIFYYSNRGEEYRPNYDYTFARLSNRDCDGHHYNADGIVVDTGVSVETEIGNGYIVLDYLDECAYKTVTETADVVVKEIIWNHTRTGRYVPVVIYDEVELSGAKCNRATGHNAYYLVSNGIGVGSRITITRSGEVIPYILDVITPEEVDLPSYCDCGNALSWVGTDLVCNNPNCFHNQYNRLYNYIATVGSVKGASQKIISAMISYAGWSIISDIYKKPVFEWSGISKMTGLGSSSVSLANKVSHYLYDEIWYSSWIVGLGLQNIGRKVAESIGSKLFEYLNKPECLYQNWKFSEIQGIGNSIESVINFNKEEICKLYDFVKDNLIYDIKRSDDSKNIDNSDLIKVCITGKLDSGITKSEFYEKFKDVVVESDVRSCDILICNKVGSSKYNTAVKLNKQILTESEAISKFKIK